MYDASITLIAETFAVDELGDLVPTRTEREVFADVRSIGQSEFYQASAVGLRPEIKFVIPDVLEYLGERYLRYTPFAGEEQEYTVLRTYQNGNELEITCRKGVDK